jgi:hypothetical protein
MNNISDFLLNYFFSPLILFIGLIGNTFGLRVLFKKKRINKHRTKRYLFLSDSFYLFQIIGINLQYTYNLDITNFEFISCNIWYYFNYCLAPVYLLG